MPRPSNRNTPATAATPRFVDIIFQKKTDKKVFQVPTKWKRSIKHDYEMEMNEKNTKNGKKLKKLKKKVFETSNIKKPFDKINKKKGNPNGERKQERWYTRSDKLNKNHTSTT